MHCQEELWMGQFQVQLFVVSSSLGRSSLFDHDPSNSRFELIHDFFGAAFDNQVQPKPGSISTAIPNCHRRSEGWNSNRWQLKQSGSALAEQASLRSFGSAQELAAVLSEVGVAD